MKSCSTLTAILAITFATAGAGAQAPTSRYAVGGNDSVRFQTNDANGNPVQCVGIASTATPDTIEIRSLSNCSARVFATSEYNKLQVFHGTATHRGNHAGAGALIGALFTGLTIRLIAGRGCTNGCEDPGFSESAAIFFGLVGGFIGMFIGAFVEAKPAWLRVYQPLPIRVVGS